MSEPKMVTITEDEYAALKGASDFLDALGAAGVDNWEGYSNAFDFLDGKEPF